MLSVPGRTAWKPWNLIRELEPELVFLDVNMPGLDGMGVIRKLRDEGVELPHFIFVTAYDQYAVEAFRLEAMDYLLKPLDRARLAETVERARRALQEKKTPEIALAAARPQRPGQPFGCSLLRHVPSSWSRPTTAISWWMPTRSSTPPSTMA
jgi:DNA-binding LytR/AlgR family response regulator